MRIIVSSGRSNRLRAQLVSGAVLSALLTAVGARCQNSPESGARRQSAVPSATASPPTASREGGEPGLDEALANAKALLQQGATGQAEVSVREILKAHPGSGEAHFLLGYILFDEIHQEYVAQEGKAGAGFRYNDDVGQSLAKVRDTKAKESLAEFSAGARYGTPSAFDLKIVALDYVLLKDTMAADKWLTLSLKGQPADAQGWYYLGRTKYSEGRFAEAIEAFEKCLKLTPRNVVAEYNVGLAYQGLGQSEQAAQAYQNAVAWEEEAGEKAPEPYVALGGIYLDQHQPEKALPYLQQAVSSFPQADQARQQLAKAYSALHRLREAQQQLEAAVQLSPQKAPLHCMLGQVYRQEQLLPQAQAEYDRCAALQHSAPKVAGEGKKN